MQEMDFTSINLVFHLPFCRASGVIQPVNLEMMIKGSLLLRILFLVVFAGYTTSLRAGG